MAKKILLIILLSYLSAWATATGDAIRDKGVLYFDGVTNFVSGGYGLFYEKGILPYAALGVGFEFTTMNLSLAQGESKIFWYSYSLKNAYKIYVTDSKVDFMFLFSQRNSNPWKFGSPSGIGITSYALKGSFTMTDSSLDYTCSQNASGVGTQLMVTIVNYQPVKHLSLSLGGQAFVAKIDVPQALEFTRPGKPTIVKDLLDPGESKRVVLFYPEFFLKIGYVF